MDGISLQEIDNVTVCRVESLSDDLKGLIRDELSAICLGRSLVAEDAHYYSYSNTLKKFLETYDNIAQTQKIGIVGELLAHLLISRHRPDFKIVTLLLNKEDLQIRKGFDLVYLSDKELWYGESKSGELQQGTPIQKIGRLLSDAKNGIKDYLEGSRSKLWDSAILEASQTLGSEESLTAKELLRNDTVSLQSGVAIKKNALLVPILFNDINNPIDIDELVRKVQNIADEEVFNDILVFCIHKSTYSKIVEFLKAEAV